MLSVMISLDDLNRASKAYREYEPRDSMYRVSAFLLDEWWGDRTKMVDALTVLLLTWNSPFYRYGSFDQGNLESCLSRHWPTIDGFRYREIASLQVSDHQPLLSLFIIPFPREAGLDPAGVLLVVKGAGG